MPTFDRIPKRVIFCLKIQRFGGLAITHWKGGSLDLLFDCVAIFRVKSDCTTNQAQATPNDHFNQWAVRATRMRNKRSVESDWSRNGNRHFEVPHQTWIVI